MAIQAALVIGPGNFSDIAARANAGRLATRRTLSNMRDAGEVVVARHERINGVSRPVCVFALAQASCEAAPGLLLSAVWFAQKGSLPVAPEDQGLAAAGGHGTDAVPPHNRE